MPLIWGAGDTFHINLGSLQKLMPVYSQTHSFGYFCPALKTSRPCRLLLRLHISWILAVCLVRDRRKGRG